MIMFRGTGLLQCNDFRSHDNKNGFRQALEMARQTDLCFMCFLAKIIRDPMPEIGRDEKKIGAVGSTRTSRLS